MLDAWLVHEPVWTSSSKPKKSLKADPETLFERPVCQKCGWVGAPVIVSPSPNKHDKGAPDSECVIMDEPLREFPYGRSSNEKDE